MNRKKHIVIIILALLICCVCFLQYIRCGNRKSLATHEMMDVKNLAGVLIYYAKLNNGRLPAGWNDLVAAKLIEPSKKYHRGIYSKKIEFQSMYQGAREINDVTRFKITFGIGPASITVTKTEVLGPDNKQIFIIAPAKKTILPESFFLGETYRIGKAMKKIAAESSIKPRNTLLEDQ